MNKVQKLALTAGLLALALTFSCSSDDGGEDPADKGNDIGNYKTVKIGGQTWMAENLNYNVEGSKCYGEGGNVYDHGIDGYVALSNAEIQSNCDKYGRLYDWATAMALPESCNSSECAGQIQAKHKGICPSGWHIPTNSEWDALYKYADSDYEVEWGSSETAGKHLKAQSGWNENGNGLDTHGFAALSGGIGSSDGYFGGAGSLGYWWSSSEYDDDNAYSRDMNHYYEDARWGDYSKAYLFSVRCVQD